MPEQNEQNMPKIPEGLEKTIRQRSKDVTNARLASLPSEDIRRLYTSEVGIIEGRFNIQYGDHTTSVEFNARIDLSRYKGTIQFECDLPDSVDPFSILLINTDKSASEIERLDPREKNGLLAELDYTPIVAQKTQNGFDVPVRYPDQEEQIANTQNQMFLQYVLRD